MKKRFQTGGNIHAVPASRQNAEPRTPSGVRPVSSPVAPIKSDVQGVMKHGGEVKDMKKPKKMALGGPAGRLTQQFGGKGADRGGMGRLYSGPANPPPNYVGTAGNIPGGFMGGQRAMNPGVNVGANIGPGAGGMPIGGGLGGFGGIGPIGGKPSDMRYPVGPNGGPAGPGNLYPSDRAMGSVPGPGFGAGGMPRGPAMKKGGKVSASSYNDMTGGAGGGIGRLEKTSIAAKTKSQKLKKGGKVKGYAAGGLSAADVYAMTGKYGSSSDEEAGRREKGLEAYRARQDAADKRASESAARNRARKAMETPRNAGGGPRGSAEMKRQSRLGQDLSREMDLENAQDRDLEKNLKAIRRNSENANRADKIREIGRKVAARNSMAQGALSNDAPLPGITKGGEYAVRGARFINGLFPDGPALPPEPGSPADIKRRQENGMKRGGMTKMAKGGKAEAFEGTARDMAEDKKLAKKYGMSKKAYEKSEIDAKHDKQRSMKGLKMGGAAKMAMGGYAAGGMSTAQDGMKPALRPKPSAMAKGGKAEMHDKGCKCMKCGGVAKYAKGGAVKSGKTFGKPLPGTKTVGPIRSTTATGANMKKDGMKGQLRAKASGAKPTNMMKPLGMTKMASGGKVRGTGIAQRGTKFIGEV